MDTLRASLEETLAGQGRVVVLLGEPGIGKTRLATELTFYAQDQGMQVLIGRCPDSDGAPPYWPWVQIVRAYVDESDPQQLHVELGAGAADLAHVIPAIRERFPDLPPPPRLEPQQERFRFFDSLTTFLKNVAKRHPLLLLLDDLQWADAPALLFLQFLVRELVGVRLLLVITCRDSEAVQQPLLSQTLAAIARAVGSRAFRLSGLTLNDVTEFLELTTGQPSSAAMSAAVFQRTEGHPFFMTEVVRLLTRDQRVVTSTALATALPVLPPTVRSVIEQHLATVSVECQQVLILAAVLGREFRRQVLDVVATLQEGGRAKAASVLALLDEALAARLITLAPQTIGRYSFTHALIQETLYESLATTERLNLHRQAGEALEAMAGHYPTPVLSELAHHFFQAAQSGREADVDKAITYAMRTAEGATALLAYEEAITQYERAIQLLSFRAPDEELHCELLLALGKAQNRASDFAAAKQCFQLAANLARNRRSSHKLADAALGLAGTRIPVSGANPSVLQLLHEALDVLPQEDYALRAQLLARLAKELTYSEFYEQREQYSHEAVRLARRTTDPYALGAALCDHCVATWRPDTLNDRLSLSMEISALAEQVGDIELIFYSRFLRIANMLEQGDSLTIDAEIAGFARHMTEIRPPIYFWVWFHERLQTMRALLAGRFAEAEQQLLSAAPLLARTPDSRDAAPLVFPQFLILRREQGRFQDPELEKMLKHGTEQYPALSALRCALAYVRAELGREVEARSEFEYWAEQNFTTVPQRQDRLVTFTYLVEMCTMWRDVARAAQLYEILLPYVERNVVVGMAIGHLDTVAHLLGKLATVLGRYSEAQSHFEFSLQRNTHLGARPRLAQVQYSYVCMLLNRGQLGDQEQAVTLLDQALATAQELEMVGLEGKVQSQKSALKVQQTPVRVQHETNLASDVSEPKAKSQLVPSVFRREGDYWTITYQGSVLRLKDTTGLQYLFYLLRSPGQEVHVLDLVKNALEAPSNSKAISSELESSDLGDAGEVLDPQARVAYKQRLEDLREELHEAQSFNDVARIERLEQEMTFLTKELTSAYGLGGRQRKAASAAQRARVNVTLSIKNVMKKIDKQHPSLALYFSTTIKTGMFCSYTPDPRIPVFWEF